MLHTLVAIKIDFIEYDADVAVLQMYVCRVSPSLTERVLNVYSLARSSA